MLSYIFWDIVLNFPCEQLWKEKWFINTKQISYAKTLFLFTRYSWRHQMREFKSEFRVVALDLRGYGETDAPAHRENYKLDGLITDIKDILECLGALTAARLPNL